MWQEEASRQERDTAALSLSPGGLGHPKSPRATAPRPLVPSAAFTVSAMVPTVHFGSLLEQVPWPEPQFA